MGSYADIKFWILSCLLVTVKVNSLGIFYNDTLTWQEARQFCINNGGQLASTITDVTSLVTGDNLHVWTGIYRAWSNFAADLGCRNLSSITPKVYQATDTGWYYCQHHCSGTRFFSYQNGYCYCLKDEPLPKTNFTCGCEGCTGKPVFMHNIRDILPAVGDVNTTIHKCVSAQCDQMTNKTTLRSEDCQKSYNGICANGDLVGLSTQSQAVYQCNASSTSFLQWLDSDSCVDQMNAYWTSATRDIYTADIGRIDPGSQIFPVSCQYVVINGTNVAIEFGNCSESKGFVCNSIDSGSEDNIFLGALVYFAVGCIFILIVAFIFIATTNPKKKVTRRRSRKKSFEDIFGDDNCSFTPVSTLERDNRSYSIQIADLEEDTQSGAYLDMAGTLKKNAKAYGYESMSKKSRSIRFIDGGGEHDNYHLSRSNSKRSLSKGSYRNNSIKKRNLDAVFQYNGSEKGSVIPIAPPIGDFAQSVKRKSYSRVENLHISPSKGETITNDTSNMHINEKRPLETSSNVSLRNNKPYTQMDPPSTRYFHNELAQASRRMSERISMRRDIQSNYPNAQQESLSHKESMQKSVRRHTPLFPIELNLEDAGSITSTFSEKHKFMGNTSALPVDKYPQEGTLERESSSRINSVHIYEGEELYSEIPHSEEQIEQSTKKVPGTQNEKEVHGDSSRTSLNTANYPTDSYDNVDFDFCNNENKFKMNPAFPKDEASSNFDATMTAELADDSSSQANEVIDNLIKELMAFEEENFPGPTNEMVSTENINTESVNKTTTDSDILIVDDSRHLKDGAYDELGNVTVLSSNVSNKPTTDIDDSFSGIIYSDNYSDIKDPVTGYYIKQSQYDDIDEPPNNIPLGTRFKDQQLQMTNIVSSGVKGNGLPTDINQQKYGTDIYSSIDDSQHTKDNVIVQSNYDQVDEEFSDKSFAKLQTKPEQLTRPLRLNNLPSDDYDELGTEDTYVAMSPVDIYIQPDRQKVSESSAFSYNEQNYTISEEFNSANLEKERYSNNASSSSGGNTHQHILDEPVYAVSSKQSIKKKPAARESTFYDKLHENRLEDRSSSMYHHVDDTQ